MQNNSLASFKHDHTFGQDQKRTGERRTLIVIVITGLMMVVEIVSGVIFGSIALLADGIHMGSHAAALMITAAAYIYARKQAGNQNYNFGTGKVNSLAGFSSAIVLGAFALTMVVESVERFLNPGVIEFDQAILVAGVGLVVNVVSAFFLNSDEDHSHQHHEYRKGGENHHQHSGTDHNLRSAYLHVVADALTSVLAIVALLGGKFFDLIWLDPMMGLVGAVLIFRWSWGLIRETNKVLLDRQPPEKMRRALLEELERREEDQVSDLHLWQIGPGIYAAIVAVVSSHPLTVEEYKQRIPEELGVVHATVEVHKQ